MGGQLFLNIRGKLIIWRTYHFASGFASLSLWFVVAWKGGLLRNVRTSRVEGRYWEGEGTRATTSVKNGFFLILFFSVVLFDPKTPDARGESPGNNPGKISEMFLTILRIVLKNDFALCRLFLICLWALYELDFHLWEEIRVKRSACLRWCHWILCNSVMTLECDGSWFFQKVQSFEVSSQRGPNGEEPLYQSLDSDLYLHPPQFANLRFPAFFRGRAASLNLRFRGLSPMFSWGNLTEKGKILKFWGVQNRWWLMSLFLLVGVSAGCFLGGLQARPHYGGKRPL